MDGHHGRTENRRMPFRRPLLLAVAACLASAAWAQPQPASFATLERDQAALYVAQNNFVVDRLGAECLVLVGRAESREAFSGAWRERNARFVAASAKYLDQRLEEVAATGGQGSRDAALRELRALVHKPGEATLASLLRGRKEDACMREITKVEAGAYDISTRVPSYGQLEALVRWAEQ